MEIAIWRLYRSIGHETFRRLSNNTLAAIICEFAGDGDGDDSLIVSEVSERIAEVKRDQQQLAKLLKLPTVVQRSQEWFELRKERLTASDAHKALIENRSRDILVRNKAFPDQAKFISTVATQWGTTFESMALRMYRARHENITVHEFGLIPHPNLTCFGASPDGISELGVMIEIKCPWTRELKPDYIPEYYEVQMQGQLAVCNLKYCDYTECKITPHKTHEKYIREANKLQPSDYGIFTNGMYSPSELTAEETIAWARQVDPEFDKRSIVTPYASTPEEIINGVILWTLDSIQIQRVLFDPERWEDMRPKFEKFWQDVLNLRKKEAIDFIDDDD
jgi:putative phage-type endonuclease